MMEWNGEIRSMMNGKEYEGKQQCDGKKRYILYRNHLLRMGLILL
ncbi:hypothetical protein V7114_01245 [Neobacillus niacini]